MISRRISVPTYFQKCIGYIKGRNNTRIPCDLHYCGMTEDETVTELAKIVKQAAANVYLRFHPLKYTAVTCKTGFVKVPVWSFDFWKSLFKPKDKSAIDHIISKHLRRETND